MAVIIPTAAEIDDQSNESSVKIFNNW